MKRKISRSPVPDYQVPHCHNTDEFYYFIGNHPDLTGLEGQIIFEGKVHKIVSPACVYIPTGAVHEYKVTRGAGTVTVLFRNRGYTHEDQPLMPQGRARLWQVCQLYLPARCSADDGNQVSHRCRAGNALRLRRWQTKTRSGLLHRGAQRVDVNPRRRITSISIRTIATRSISPSAPDQN